MELEVWLLSLHVSLLSAFQLKLSPNFKVSLFTRIFIV